ncbi:MAG: hypothetical protein KAQ92_02290 [Candidatus Aenigmarchaeota archaeon]|nr:hypothetical protein [Candidatus Aenigmarchaeota archaeon]
MKKIIAIALIAMFVATVFSANVMASAPNSGDGESDGPGWDGENPRPGEVVGEGPAPNSGDGIPDGSGF